MTGVRVRHLAADRFHAVDDRFDHHDHAGSAPEGAIIDFSMGSLRPLADVVQVHLDQAGVDGPLQTGFDPSIQERLRERGSRCQSASWSPVMGSFPRRGIAPPAVSAVRPPRRPVRPAPPLPAAAGPAPAAFGHPGDGQPLLVQVGPLAAVFLNRHLDPMGRLRSHAQPV